MQAEKRRRRIERIKICLRVLFFLKRNFKRGLIIVGCLMFLSFAGYFSIQYAQAAEEEKYVETKTSDSVYLKDMHLAEEAIEISAVEVSEELEKYATSHKIRYRNADMPVPVDAAFKLIGEDLSALVITKLTVSDFAVSNIDTVIPVKVTIQAEDDSTSYPDLQYAFLPEGHEPEEADWHKKSSFDVELTQNGKWTAYCKDKAGNIVTEEKDIIAVDNKAPFVTLQLETEAETWCGKNVIAVNATDALPVEYCYSCLETGEESGWIIQNKKEVLENGTWKIQVRDEAGNIAESEITVSNIDKQPPVILEIKEVKEKGSYENEE